MIFSVTYTTQTTEKGRDTRKQKPSVLGLSTPSHTDPKWSPVIDQFQLCLEQTSPFIHVLWSLPLWPDCTGAGGERFPPPWQDKMKEDGRVVRFLDRHSREPTLWMIMDCSHARLTPCLILFIPWAPRVLHLNPRSQGLSWSGQAHAYSTWVPLMEPSWSNHSEIWVNKQCSIRLHTGRVESRGTKENCSLGFRAWQGDRGCVVDKNVGGIPLNCYSESKKPGGKT